MSKKRSAREAFLATGNGSQESQKITKVASDGEQAPLSAFAAARAASKAATTVTPNEAVEEMIKDPRKDAELLVRSLNLPFGATNDSQAVEAHGVGPLGGDVSEYDSEDGITTTDVLPTVPVQSRKLSTVKPDSVSEHEDHIVINLELEEDAVLLGTYDLEVRKGTVVVYGALLRPSGTRHRIYAPSTHALPVISAKAGAAEVAIHSIIRQPLRELSRLSPLWSKTWHEDFQESTRYSFCLLRSTSDDTLKRPILPLEVDSETQQALNKIMSHKASKSSPSPKVMVIGPKGSGKSTFCRLLANTLLTAPKPWTKTSCFWLDLDPGQPEFGPPGQLSLVQIREPILGPSFAHVLPHPSLSSRCIRAHSIAAISPKEDVEHFIACAKDLLKQYNSLRIDFPSAPLIINCSGWVAGSALPVLSSLTELSTPTDLVLLPPIDLTSIATLQQVLKPEHTLWNLPPRQRTPQIRTSAESRAMQSMSYMHSTIPISSAPSWTTEPLTALSPFRVSYGGPNPGISAILSYHDVVPSSQLATVLDVSTVAIVAISDSRAFAPSTESTHLTLPSNNKTTDLADLIVPTPEGLPYVPYLSRTGVPTPLDPRHSHTLGQALIRGIDTSTQELILLTPVSSAIIKQSLSRGEKLVLVRGKFDIPDWALLEDVHAARSTNDETKRPYVSPRRADQGIGGSVWRVRHLPRRGDF